MSDKPIFSLERISNKDFDASVQLKKEFLVVILKRLGAKTNCLVVTRQS
jgi:hypothetical protein